MRQYYFQIPFATSGDLATVPVPIQGSGAISFTSGWGFDYQRDLATDPAAKAIDRSTTNYLFNTLTAAVQALQVNYPEWVTAAQNSGTAVSYSKGATVQYSATGNPPFVKYVSLIDSNTDTPGATANWQVVVDAKSTSAQATAGTDNNSIMTPALVAQQDALRALLAGATGQQFNVAAATGATQAVNLGQLPVFGGAQNAAAFLAAAASSMTFTADTVVMKTALNGLSALTTSFTKVLNLAATGLGGMDTGAPPNNGYVAVYAAFGTTPGVGIFAQNVTSASATEQYSGANIPTNVTHTQLLAVLPTDGTGKFKPATLAGRRVDLIRTIVASGLAAGSFTALNIASVIPIGAKEVRGHGQASSNIASTVELDVASTASGIGYVPISSTSVLTALGTFSLPVITAQTMYYMSTATAGTANGFIAITGYIF